jgi:hypothetical protein
VIVSLSTDHALDVNPPAGSGGLCTRLILALARSAGMCGRVRSRRSL